MGQVRYFFQDRVDAGAALLDREDPGWALHVDLDKLGMANIGGKHCVLAQTFGSYGAGLRRLKLTRAEGTRHGFDLRLISGIFTGIIAFPVLTAAWKMEIEARQHVKAVA